MNPLSLLFCALLAFADAAPPPAAKPKEIPADRKESISQVMLNLQYAQLRMQELELQIRAAQDKAEADAKVARERIRKVVDDAQTKYDALQDQLRKEFHAEGCEMQSDKTWRCGGPAAAPPPPQTAKAK